jgi:hypothetical protein
MKRKRETEQSVSGGGVVHFRGEGEYSFFSDLEVPRQWLRLLRVQVLLSEGKALGSEEGEELGSGLFFMT